MAAALAARPARYRRLPRAASGEQFGIDAAVKLAVGVERWDFTKGIVERCQALESYLELQSRQRAGA